MNFLTLFLLLSVVDVGAVISGRYYVFSKNKLFLIISLVCFGFSAYLFYLLMAFKSTAIVNLLWVSLSTIFISMISYFLFKEKITWGQSVGMFFIILGIIIMEL